ncbi:NFX1-type zinc finger-containing protein 1-like [Haliotis rufescens]|uniref:NFX1-type zinc finger-containing protein 1-like n=1 Tax=Haliotis rufescens TaxID=6454 RepID=UPI00201F37EA|nr:NFX1-type zinc finger-containing protein 1-like [Haliotis rufescens]XP_046375696.2 NFX1-type zinc finger-containing protein 1-like [Haliotis rufescens]XP_046375697.2 NFX1-type zinc finger-containing protein 1-like [Haliotis rufescens]XP_046375698.2 NFX1-type zinc finger-containing protein 1-like [Haliotis rufescens]
MEDFPPLRPASKAGKKTREKEKGEKEQRTHSLGKLSLKELANCLEQRDSDEKLSDDECEDTTTQSQSSINLPSLSTYPDDNDGTGIKDTTSKRLMKGKPKKRKFVPINIYSESSNSETNHGLDRHATHGETTVRDSLESSTNVEPDYEVPADSTIPKTQHHTDFKNRKKGWEHTFEEQIYISKQCDNHTHTVNMIGKSPISDGIKDNVTKSPAYNCGLLQGAPYVGERYNTHTFQRYPIPTVGVTGVNDTEEQEIFEDKRENKHSKKGKKRRTHMVPAPVEMLGFKTKNPSRNTKTGNGTVIANGLDLKPSNSKRQAQRKTQMRAIPIIHQDDTDSSDELVDRDYRWIHENLTDRTISLSLLRSLQCQASSVIALTLARNVDLEHLLNNEDFDIEHILLLLSLISKGCECQVVPKTGLQILTKMTGFLSKHLHSLTKRLAEKVHTIESLTIQNFFRDMVTILKEMVRRVKDTGTDPTAIPRLILTVTAKQFKTFLEESHHQILLDLASLKEARVKACEDTFLHKDDNFRHIKLMPTNDDINPSMKPSLTKNKAVGRYTDVDEYLDVQYRLLREDFIQPLREGVSEYQDLLAMKDRKTIRLYQNVLVRRFFCSEDGIVYRLQFDVSKLSQVDWGNTKRLMYGSMVCISSDNFKTVRFAIISDRKPEKLQQGRIDIKFDNKVKLDPGTQFAMVETPALFVAYRHVLIGIQQIESNKLPMSEYFVECRATLATPEYLRHDDAISYDMSGLAMTSKDSGTSINSVSVCQEVEWPIASDLDMDESQFHAFHTALTKELAIIQGPPGTGKTYVGLKIVKALMQNRHAWNPDNSRPLLVVCYTNHALDQFLEGILTFFKGKVLRVGGRSKSDILINHNLNRKRSELFRHKTFLDEDISNILEIRQELREDFTVCQKELEEYGQQIDATTEGVLHEDYLKPFMKQQYRKITNTFGKKDCFSALLEWLDIQGIGKEKLSMHPTVSAEPKGSIQNDDIEQVDENEEVDETEKERKLDDIDEYLQLQTRNLSMYRNRCLAVSLLDCDLTDEQWKTKHKTSMKRDSRQTLKTRLRRELLSRTKMEEHEASSVDANALSIADRWRLYRYWVELFCQRMHHLMEPLKSVCQNAADRYKEANALVDKYVFEHSSVIGLTTTGAARYQTLLTDIQPPIVIVEEAAEVLEGHIITSLSPGCQHLILIGDHKQLRPNPNVYELARRYNLDLSLFERMINNGLHCDCLELQHRMRPSISKVLRHIYDKLKDHESVFSYGDVRGISENIYFINHSVQESENKELLSHLNDFEAKYITKLCQYLLKQGYSHSQITVLSTYSAQVSHLRSMMTQERQEGLLITAVDNYQGEENDIVLLSLVRSNQEEKIGFLKTDNRICVALSRAKIGLYVIGNFDLLARHSETWKNIIQDLNDSNQIGPGLELYCQTHPRTDRIVVTDLKMFQQVPEGGCMKQCHFILNCGHTCTLKCHAYDPMHVLFSCKKECQRTICNLGHPCPAICSDKCPPCEFPVSRTIPKCQHTQEIPCSVDPGMHVCLSECEEILECGHKCGNLCGYDHICYETVPKTWPCGHTGEVLCTEKDQGRCLVRCDAKLLCGHTCEGFCYECNEGRLHVPCKKKCTKILICGHPCKASCSRCPPCTLDCETACPHSKCQNPCGQKCQQCDKPCLWACAHFKCKQLCGDVCDRNRCDKRCRKKLECKHTCIGLCGETCPGYCRICHKDDVSAFLPESEDISTARFIFLEKCGHIVEVHALDRIMENVQASKQIQLPCCPWCSTPIRRNTRYGAILNQIHKQMEMEKAALAEMTTERLTTLQNVIHTDIDSFDCEGDVSELIANAGEDESRLVAVKNQKTFLIGMEKLKSRITEPQEEDHDGIWHDINKFEQWLKIQRDVFTEQEVSDAHHEFQRNTIAVFLHELLSRESKDNLLPSTLALLQKVRAVIKTKEKITEDEYKLVTELKHDVSHVIADIEFYDKLSKDKMPAWRHLKAAQGHWFRCPVSDDHIYYAEDDLMQDECYMCIRDQASLEGDICQDSKDTDKDC